MSNVPLQQEPHTLDGMRLEEQLLKWTENRIAQTPDKSKLNDIPNITFVTGDSGTGKGTWVRNLIRTVHCRNREIGSSKGCGKCDICQSDPRDLGELGNVIWVECGSREGESDYKKVQHAMNVSTRGPHKTNNPHRDILFIVFDEVHLLSRVDQSALLTLGEHNASDVKYICITAEPEEMKSKVRRMLKDRGAWVKMPKPNSEDLVSYLKSQTETLNFDPPEETLRLLAQSSEGSYREALSRLFFLSQNDPSLSPDVAALLLQTLTWRERQIFWEKMAKARKRKEIREIIERVRSQADDETLAKILLEDLYYSDEDKIKEEDNALAILLLSEWLRRPYTQDIRYTLIQLKKLNCVDYSSEIPPIEKDQVVEDYAP